MADIIRNYTAAKPMFGKVIGRVVIRRKPKPGSKQLAFPAINAPTFKPYKVKKK